MTSRRSKQAAASVLELAQRAAGTWSEAERARVLAAATRDGTRGRRADPEHVEQSLLFQWADVAVGQRPELAALYAVPNGGHRTKAQAAKLQREGVRPGVPDWVLPVPRGGYAALFGEMKTPGNYPTPEQRAWHARLTALGNLVVVCRSAEAAQREIERYLDLPTERAA